MRPRLTAGRSRLPRLLAVVVRVALYAHPDTRSVINRRHNPRSDQSLTALVVRAKTNISS